MFGSEMKKLNFRYALLTRMFSQIYYYDKGHVYMYLNKWKLKLKHKNISNQCSEYCPVFDVGTVETPKRFSGNFFFYKKQTNKKTPTHF